MSLVPTGEGDVSPFGLPFRTPIDDLQIVAELGEGKFEVSPPRPHPLMDSYIVQAGRRVGVVWIKAISPVISGDDYGTHVRALVDRLSQQLVQRYCAPKKTELLLDGALWNEPRDWLSAVNAGERLYSYTWDRRSGAKLPLAIETIYAGVITYDSGSCSAAIEYASPLMDQVKVEIDAEMADYL